MKLNKPWFFLPAIQGELTRALFMGAGWVINLVVAEWVIRKRLASQHVPSQPLSKRGGLTDHFDSMYQSR